MLFWGSKTTNMALDNKSHEVTSCKVEREKIIGKAFICSPCFVKGRLHSRFLRPFLCPFSRPRLRRFIC
jgi:hypothetical protein